jgi:methionine-rich copper-binding protein CopC
MPRVVLRRILLRGAGLAVAAALARGRADAHAVLVRSSPARRAVLGQPPRRVELAFNERLEAAYSSLSVWTADGVQVDMRDVAVSAADPRVLSVGVPPLAPGAYTVKFRVLSVDGHVVEATFPFTVSGRR